MRVNMAYIANIFFYIWAFLCLFLYLGKIKVGMFDGFLGYIIETFYQNMTAQYLN